MFGGLIAALIRSVPELAKLSQLFLDALRDFQSRFRSSRVTNREAAKLSKLDAAVRDALKPDGVPEPPSKTEQP
jgi:hypothetical protein